MGKKKCDDSCNEELGDEHVSHLSDSGRPEVHYYSQFCNKKDRGKVVGEITGKNPREELDDLFIEGLKKGLFD